MEIDGAERPAPSRACGFLFVRDDWAFDDADGLERLARFLVHAHLSHRVERIPFGMYYFVHKKTRRSYLLHCSDCGRYDGGGSEWNNFFSGGSKNHEY